MGQRECETRLEVVIEWLSNPWGIVMVITGIMMITPPVAPWLKANWYWRLPVIPRGWPDRDRKIESAARLGSFYIPGMLLLVGSLMIIGGIRSVVG